MIYSDPIECYLRGGVTFETCTIFGQSNDDVCNVCVRNVDMYDNNKYCIKGETVERIGANQKIGSDFECQIIGGTIMWGGCHDIVQACRYPKYMSICHECEKLTIVDKKFPVCAFYTPQMMDGWLVKKVSGPEQCPPNGIYYDSCKKIDECSGLYSRLTCGECLASQVINKIPVSLTGCYDDEAREYVPDYTNECENEGYRSILCTGLLGCNLPSNPTISCDKCDLSKGKVFCVRRNTCTAIDVPPYSTYPLRLSSCILLGGYPMMASDWGQFDPPDVCIQ